MEKTRDYVVDGYTFHNRADAEKAQKELDGITYLKQNVQTADGDRLLQIYHKMLEQGLFETPVGLGYLHELQGQLKKSGLFTDEMIAPIDITSFRVGGMRKVQETPEGELQDTPKKRGRKKKKEVQDDVITDYRVKQVKGQLRISLFVILVLVLVIGAMLYIASTTNSVTILNYENALIDKYESWQNELEEREEAVKAYEEKYGIESDSTD